MTETIYKNWKKLTAIFVGLGLLGMSFGTFAPTAFGGFTLGSCDSGNGIIEHWDKIVFSSPSAIKKPDQSIIPRNELLDIKVLDDPNSVADLRQKVVDFLNSHGFTRPNGSPFAKHLIVIDEVEYAIICVSFGPV